jgi:hypothetical protein
MRVEVAEFFAQGFVLSEEKSCEIILAKLLL